MWDSNLKRVNVTYANYTSINLKKINFHKDPVKKTRGKPWARRKSEHMSDKGLLSRI